MRKLRSKRGETIIESLVAIIIVSMCVSFLMESIVCAAKINKHLGDKPLTFEYDSGAGESGSIKVTNKDADGKIKVYNASIDVKFHQTSGGYTYYD